MPSYLKRCPHCERNLDARGYTVHLRACKDKFLEDLQRQEIIQGHARSTTVAELLDTGGGRSSGLVRRHFNVVDEDPFQHSPDVAVYNEAEDTYNMPFENATQAPVDYDPAFEAAVIMPPSNGDEDDHIVQDHGEAVSAQFGESEEGDDLIRTTYHPHSKIPDEQVPFSQYRASKIEQAPAVTIEDAYGPFDSDIDADFCEWILDSNISEPLGTKLISIIHRFVGKQRAPQVNSWNDWRKTMDAAAAVTTPFKKETFTMPFQGEEITYTILYRDIVQDVLTTLDNINLQPLLERWARRTFKSHDGGQTWERFVTQPWTGDLFWEIDSLFADLTRFPIRILIYSDKTRLSSFGNVTGWPIYWRLLHLDSNIRNGTGLGGARLLALLPNFPEEQKYKGKTGWVDYKRRVFMRGYGIVLEPIAKQPIGGTARHLPSISPEVLLVIIIVMIISADLDEQSLFSLTRGFNANTPCTVCLVKKEDLLNPTPAKERTVKHEKSLYEWAQKPGRQSGETEKAYAKFGLRFLENIMWMHLPHIDYHRALSVCTMHTNAGGNWPHIKGELVDIIILLSKKFRQDLVAEADAQMSVFPRWPNLSHFHHWLSKDITDATKNEDMSIQAMFCLHSILLGRSKIGYSLLRALRAYHEMNAYGNLTVHTETTLREGLSAHKKYNQVLSEIEKLYPESKSWSFTKSHTPMHLFRNILLKGVQLNFSTKPSEHKHRDLKVVYQHRSNFKNVEEQLARYEGYHDGMLEIRHHIEMHKAALKALNISEEYEDVETDQHLERMAGMSGPEPPRKRVRKKVNTVTQSPLVTVHSHMCAAGGRKTLKWMENLSEDDAAYIDFGSRLNAFVAPYINEHRDQITLDHPELTAGGHIEISPNSMIHRYAELRVSYASEVDWEAHTNLLRCNPSFNNRMRYDCVLAEGSGPCELPFFARLVTVFRCFPFGNSADYSIVCALVQPYDQNSTHREPAIRARKKKIDQDLRFYRVRSRPRADSIIIPVERIVRGAVLVEDYDGQPPIVLDGWTPDFLEVKDYLVVDLVDEDLFIRMQTLGYAGRREGLF